VYVTAKSEGVTPSCTAMDEVSQDAEPTTNTRKKTKEKEKKKTIKKNKTQ
jgi:hypothetical protein